MATFVFSCDECQATFQMHGEDGFIPTHNKTEPVFDENGKNVLGYNTHICNGSGEHKTANYEVFPD